MEDIKISEYLMNPNQVQIALNLLDEKCLELGFEELFRKFGSTLRMQDGDGFPITPVTLGGMICRARLNTDDFRVATSTSQIGAKFDGILQGRANPNNRTIFYSANNRKTAAYEVLQGKRSGIYNITIGCWKSKNKLRVANLIDGLDPDFTNISFAHSMPNSYVKDWPELPRKSALMLIEYFKEKFKMHPIPGLYNITNVIAAICYSLGEIDGIGYAAISDKFDGYNIAISEPSRLNCVAVERWLLFKNNDEVSEFELLD